MRTLVMYYSKTGNSQNVARAVARKLQIDLQEIRCDQYLGSAGDLRAGIDNILGRKPKLPEIPDLDEYDQIILGGPIWLGRPSAPIRAAAHQYLKSKRNVGLFICGMGPEDIDSAAKQLASILDNPPRAVLKVHGAMLDTPDFKKLVEKFCSEMSKELVSA